MDNLFERIYKNEVLTDEEFENIFKVGVYHGLFDKENYGFHDRKNSVYLFLGTLQGIMKNEIVS